MNVAQGYANHERTMLDVLEAIFRHKMQGLLFFAAVTITAAGVLALSPDQHTSSAKLMIRRGGESVFPDPSTSSGKMLPMHKEWQSAINTELEILGSRELIVTVIETIGSDRFLNAPAPDGSGPLDPVLSALVPIRQWIEKWFVDSKREKPSLPESGNQVQLGKALKIIEENLYIDAPKKSDIITISYTAPTPELAQETVTGLVNTYLDKRIDVHRVPGALQFFSQQTELLLKELKLAEDTVRQIKDTAGISSLQDSRQSLQNSIETVRTQQLENEADLASANARVSILQSMLAKQTTSSPGVEKSGTILDPKERLELQATLHTDKITQASLTAAAKKLSQLLSELRIELAGINALEAPLRNQERELSLLEEQYRRYSEDKERVRISEELEIRNISNVSIVQHATLPLKADPSGNFFKFIAISFIGMIGAITLSTTVDKLDPALHSSSDVFSRLQLNTLLELPKLRSNSIRNISTSAPHEIPAGKRKGLLSNHPSRTTDDYFQELLFNVISTQNPEENIPFVIGVTSTSSGEGVSSIASHLATAFSRDNRFSNVLLLSTRPTSGTDKKILRAKDLPFTFKSVHSDAEPKNTKDTPKNIKDQASFVSRLIHEKQEGFAVIIVDLPPMDEDIRVAQSASELDCVLLVIEAESTPWRDALHSSEILQRARVKLCGVVLNRINPSIPQWIYQKL